MVAHFRWAWKALRRTEFLYQEAFAPGFSERPAVAAWLRREGADPEQRWRDFMALAAARLATQQEGVLKMAGLAVSALEAAILALLAALGVRAADDVARRQRAVSKAGTSPAAKTATQTRTKVCDKCPPDCGILVARKWNMSATAREYQARVTGFAPFTEWNFAMIDFDGFSSADRTLKEAKSRYDQFLSEGEDGAMEPKKWFKAFRTKMAPQAATQARVAAASPPARPMWFFEGPRTYTYMAPRVMAFVPLVAVYAP